MPHNKILEINDELLFTFDDGNIWDNKWCIDPFSAGAVCRNICQI